MFLRLFAALFFLLISINLVAQEEKLLNAYTVPLELKASASAVVRYDDIDIEVLAYNKMVYTNKRIVTIFNSSGDEKHGAIWGYDENVHIKKMEARIYDAMGKEIKKIRKNDFLDVSAVDGGTLYSDSRVKYLNYTPVKYPYTILFETEIEYSSTAFLPGWRPIEGFYTSTENADYKITNSTDIKIKVKTTNFSDYSIVKNSDYHYTAKNLKALKPEAYSPSFKAYAPFLRAALTEFEMEGVKGINNDWTDFGKWMHNKLILGTQELPEGVKGEIKALTANAKTNIEKAKIVYEYMQNKTRYISVQVGIGGWKPMLAEDVDRLGYGDCKGLTNYTKALLDEVDVASFYTVVYGGKSIKNMDKEFSATEGNHVILCVPNDGENVWLECTSQTSPFGYNANFTDDRDVLLVTPEGGEIVHTKVYKTEENKQLTTAKIKIEANGSIAGNVHIESSGSQYAYHEGIQTEALKDQKLHYKDYWSNINNLAIDAMEFNNDKDAIVFVEDVAISALNYGSKSGNRLLVEPNVFNKVTKIPPRYKNRKFDFEIERGFTDTDEFTINLSPELEIEALPESVSIENKYGSYSFSIKKTEDTILLYKRQFILNKGTYSKEEYKAFRAFRSKVVRHDKTKIVLIPKT